MGRGHFLGFLDVNNRGGDFGGLGVNNYKIYRKYIDVQRKFKLLTRGSVLGGIFGEV